MQDFELPSPGINEFKSTPWLVSTLKLFEGLKPDQTIEFTLPHEVHPYFFVAELGRPQRGYEFGGMYNRKTRSTSVVRGNTWASGTPFVREGVKRPPLRENPDGTNDDILFHTHPFDSKRDPAAICLPSQGAGYEGDDLSLLLNISLIEKWDGHRRELIEVIGSGGNISVTKSTGVEIDKKKLLEAGITEEQIIDVERLLGLYPSWGLQNISSRAKKNTALFERIKSFYKSCDTDNSIGYIKKYERIEKELREKAEEYGISTKDLDDLIKALKTHEQTRQYVTTTYMENKGLTKNQALLMQSMFGIKTNVYKVDETGMALIEDPK